MIKKCLFPATGPEKALRVVASKAHLSEKTPAFVVEVGKSTENIKQVSKGSSLKLVMVAEGSADIYPRLHRLWVLPMQLSESAVK